MKKFKLPKEFAKKWVEALRSGKYGQARNVLKESRKNEYCCLGVACVISKVKKTKLLFNEWIEDYVVDGIKNFPKELIGGFGNDLAYELSKMNDNGKSFDEIADWIEANVEFV